MRRNVLIIVGLLQVLTAACGLREIGGYDSDEYGDAWKGPGMSIKPGGGAGSVKKSVWYVTGVDYPEGYDWMADSEAGSVKCSLVVYANAVPMLKVPVGREYLTSADPDMHRMIDGDLYTDYSTDSLTVIKKNGKEIFCYPGREMVIGMSLDSTGLYTLGQARNGGGLTFRRNGELLYGHARGQVVGQLSESGRTFAFSEKILGIETAAERYYLYDGGKVSQIGVRDDVLKIWDIILWEGKVHYIASMTGVSYPVHVSDDGMRMLDFPSKSKVRSCRFLNGDDALWVEGIYDDAKGILTSRLWRNDAVDVIYPTGMTLWAPCVIDGGVSGILVHHQTGEQRICRSGEIHPLPEGYAVMGTVPLAMVNGILHVGMTSLEGEHPAVWQDGEIRKLGFNGYISSISVWSL